MTGEMHEHIPATRQQWRRARIASILLGAAMVLQASSTVLAQSGKPAAKPLVVSAKDQAIEAFGGYGGGAFVPEPVVPPGVDTFNLTLDEVRLYSRSLNFEVVAHEYFKGPWLTQAAQDAGLGASFNTPRVYDGIFYGGGYNSPSILWGALIADVHDLQNMRVLSFIPCNPGTRCPYIRVNPTRKILVGTQDTSGGGPTPAVGPAKAGVTFYDVSDPSSPKLLSFVPTRPGGLAHGLDIDDRYAYACAETNDSKTNIGSNHDIVIVDYQNPTAAQIVSVFHVQGQHVGETFDVLDQLNPDGTPQKIWCHEIYYDKDRLYVAYRDAGMIILDVSDRTNPKQISRYDWVPPYNGGGLGAAHSAVPLLPDPSQYPTLLVTTDENFSCPAGFGRVFDISYLGNPQILSTYRIPYAQDFFHFPTNQWVCPSGQQTTHMPWFDNETSSLLYQAWYAQGLRALDFTNPYLPREIGYYLSPPYPNVNAGYNPRQTREPFQDDHGLIWLTDGSGGGITVLRYTGAKPPNHQIPGAR